MSNWLEPVARDYFSRGLGIPVGDQELYRFLSEHYPNLRLTPKTIKRMQWTLVMIRPSASGK